MNSIQRAFLGIYSLIWIGLCTGLIVMAWNPDQKLDIVAGDLNIQAFVDTTDSVRWAFTALMVALATLGVATFFLAVTPANGGQGRTLRVRQADGTETTISATNIASALKAELETFPEITRAAVNVDVRNGRVYTTVDATIPPDTSAGYVTSLVNEVVISLLRDRAGIGAYAPPSVRTHLEARRALVRQEPAAPVGPQPVASPFDEPDEAPAPLPHIDWEAPEPRPVRRVDWNRPTLDTRVSDE